MFKATKWPIFPMQSGINLILLKYSTQMFQAINCIVCKAAWHATCCSLCLFPHTHICALSTCTSSKHHHTRREPHCECRSCSLNVPVSTNKGTEHPQGGDRNIPPSIIQLSLKAETRRCTLTHVHAHAHAHSCNDILTTFEQAGRKQETHWGIIDSPVKGRLSRDG